MHCSRSVYRNPSVVRLVRSPAYSRNASFFPSPFFPRAAFQAQNELTPLFRLFDDFSGHAGPSFRQTGFSFQPRFDVREVGNNYELHGELPGVEGKDIEVEFTDPQTLIVRGKTEKKTTSGTPSADNAAEAEATKAAADAASADNSDAASTYSTGSYQKPSVEDEEPESSSAAAAAAEAAEPKKDTQVEKAAEEPQQASRYWVSERTVGSFQRTFNFPSRIDQDAVTASLKNGILNIVVPKAAAPVAKKIAVE